MDQRMVGHAQRRRIGAPSSHLAMATGAPAVETRIRGFSWPGPGHVMGVADDTGLAEANEANRQYAGDPDLSRVGDLGEFASEVSAVAQNEPHPPRGAINGADTASARLAISPSMKIPTESPAPTQWQGRVVQSRPGRSTGTFFQGAQETLRG